MSDISLLPEEMRSKEEELKKSPATAPPAESGNMHMPNPEAEDVDVIEVDEGDVGQVLEGEPLLSRAVFKIQTWFNQAKTGLFNPRTAEPPPKLPPQFFKPPAPVSQPKATGLVPIMGAKSIPAKPTPIVSAAPMAPPKPKARIVPAAEAPRRVRVIRRVRKPVRVSFLDDQSQRPEIDVPRRRFTMVVMAIVFGILLGGGYWMMDWQGRRAQANLEDVNAQITEVESKIEERQGNWDSFKDLEPRLTALAQLLDRHLSPSKVFDALEKFTVPEVYYSSFTLSPDGRVVLTTTAPTFETAARQVVAFQESGLVKTIQAMNYQASYDPLSGKLDSVGFIISLTLDPRVLRASQSIPVVAAQ